MHQRTVPALLLPCAFLWLGGIVLRRLSLVGWRVDMLAWTTCDFLLGVLFMWAACMAGASSAPRVSEGRSDSRPRLILAHVLTGLCLLLLTVGAWFRQGA